mgnify:FL=1
MLYEIDGQSPEIHESAFVASSADIMGSVIVRAKASVWFNVVIRGDCDLIEVGERSNIQDGSVLHVDPGQPMLIGQDVTVGHKAMLHGQYIGDRTLIGINAVVLDGAKIGSDCLIGANTLITSGTSIPDGSLVLGSPGKVISQLAQKTKDLLFQSAAHYVEKAAIMRTKCREILA